MGDHAVPACCPQQQPGFPTVAQYRVELTHHHRDITPSACTDSLRPLHAVNRSNPRHSAQRVASYSLQSTRCCRAGCCGLRRATASASTALSRSPPPTSPPAGCYLPRPTSATLAAPAGAPPPPPCTSTRRCSQNLPVRHAQRSTCNSPTRSLRGHRRAWRRWLPPRRRRRRAASRRGCGTPAHRRCRSRTWNLLRRSLWGTSPARCSYDARWSWRPTPR